MKLHLRYPVYPRQGQRIRHELYERVLADFSEAPVRIEFPIDRNL